MTEQSKVGLIILIIFCVIFASTSTAFFILQRQEHMMRIKIENELSVVKNKKAEVEKKLDEVQQEKAKTKEELISYKDKVGRLADKIAFEKTQRQQLESTLKIKEDALKSLTDSLKLSRNNISNLEKKYEDLQSKNEKLSDRLNQLRVAKQALEAKFGASTQTKGVELGKVVVTPQAKQNQEASQSKKGRILVVNKEFNFVMIDLGRMQGVKSGTKFGVYHGNTLIAKVEVEKVYEDMCSAVILQKDKKGEIFEDDLVKML